MSLDLNLRADQIARSAMKAVLKPDAQADILIVDDTLNNVRLLAEILSKAGHSVRKAISGPMALTAAQAAVPDLILLDINMPEMNGYEVCQQLKADPHTAQTPIIFLSAFDGAVDKVMAFQVGGVDYISKPFHSQEVLARIQHQLTIGQLRSQLSQHNTKLEQVVNLLKLYQQRLPEPDAELAAALKATNLDYLFEGLEKSNK